MHLNLLAILVAVIFNMVLGALWYSPIMFAKPWMKAMGFDKHDMGKMNQGAGPKYGLMFTASIVIAVILSLFIGQFGVQSFRDGMVIGFLCWLGFATTAQFTNWAFSGKPKELYVINTTYQLVAYSLIGGLLAVWR
jgi:surface polysaccharide O-acyltransferase-like enzyme